MSKRVFTAKTMAAHVERTARLLGVLVIAGRDVPTQGIAFPAWRLIMVRPITTEKRYATALHELGHCATVQPRNKLAREKVAWNWARENAIHWTPAMEVECRKALETYIKLACVDRRHKFPVEDYESVW